MIVIRLSVRASFFRVVRMKDASSDGAAYFFYLFLDVVMWLTTDVLTVDVCYLCRNN